MNGTAPKWGPHTEAALRRYPSGFGTIPFPLIHAFGLQKHAAARANAHLGEVPVALGQAIADAAQAVAAGQLDEHFPLGIWQAGDGNQTHLNVNEVIATRASELLDQPGVAHPLDHVNRNQSSNDSWPTVVHIALHQALGQELRPALAHLVAELRAFAGHHRDAVKVGRTFLGDAHFTTVGAEFGAFAELLDAGLHQIDQVRADLLRVAQGGGAVGTGVGVHDQFAAAFIDELRVLSGQAFQRASLPSTGQVVDTGLLRTSSVLVELAVIATKLCRDVELLASGPHCGLGELRVPYSGAGSTSMAGKINPAHASMLEMICMKVQAHHAVVIASLSSARLQLNTTYLAAACATLESAQVMAQGLALFASHLVAGLEVNHDRLAEHVRHGPGATFLQSRSMGYDAASKLGR